MDLKSFRSRYVLWIIDSFNRFVEGKVILNKRADTLVSAVTDMWIICFGIPSVEFYAENGKEFVNVKMDELTKSLGVSIQLGQAYSP